MRRLLTPAVLFVFVVVGACARPSSDIDRMQPGTALTVTMKDGSAVTGRLVQVKPDSVVLDPAEGGEWKTLSRDQIASVSTQQSAAAQPQPAAAAGPQPPAAQSPGTPSGTQQPTATESPRSASAPRAARPSAAAIAPEATAARREPAFREVTIPADTLLDVRLDTQVASDTSRVEDPVQASVTKPVVVDGFEAIPAGSALKGVVTQARPSGKVKGRAEVAFRFDTLAMSGGQEHRVQTRAVAVEAPATKGTDALKIGVPAAGGAILGGILGGKKGAVIGGAVGGGAGTAIVLTTPGKEVRLAPGTAMTVKLLEPVTVRVAIDR
jgi:hypothetical protein